MRAVRTTIDLDPEIHEIARRRACEERRAIGAVISELARRRLEGGEPRRGNAAGGATDVVCVSC